MAAENNDGRKRIDRRNVLKGIGGAAAATSVGAAGLNVSTEPARAAKSEDYSIYIHYENPASDSSLASYVGDWYEYNFDTYVNYTNNVSGHSFKETTYSDVNGDNYSDPLDAFEDYIKDNYGYSEGSVDVWLFDDDNWDSVDDSSFYGKSSWSGGAVNGANHEKNKDNCEGYNWLKPCAVARCRGRTNDEIVGTAMHEVVHLFSFNGTDCYGYNVDDEMMFDWDADGNTTCMGAGNDIDTCATSENKVDSTSNKHFGPTAGTFIDHQLQNDWVYYGAPDCMYNEQP
jgi:hypothetical protein